MLYNESELKKRLKSGCAVYYFYSSEEAQLRTAAEKVLCAFSEEDPEITVLESTDPRTPNPSLEEIAMAAGTVSFFGGRRIVSMPLLRPSSYTDKELEELCGILQDMENAVVVITTVMEENWGKITPSKREKTLISLCEKLGYCAQLVKLNDAALLGLMKEWAADTGTVFEQGADKLLLERAGKDQLLLQNEVDKLAALSNYTTITKALVQGSGTLTLEADTFDMIGQLTSGQSCRALEKLKTLLAMQNEPVMITGALIGNYVDMYRVFMTLKTKRGIPELVKDFSYTGNAGYRLGKVAKTVSRFRQSQLEKSLNILLQLDADLKSSKLDADLLMQKALCELALVGGQK